VSSTSCDSHITAEDNSGEATKKPKKQQKQIRGSSKVIGISFWGLNNVALAEGCLFQKRAWFT